jgi:hypothetical protein
VCGQADVGEDVRGARQVRVVGRSGLDGEVAAAVREGSPLLQQVRGPVHAARGLPVVGSLGGLALLGAQLRRRPAQVCGELAEDAGGRGQLGPPTGWGRPG